MVGTPKRIALIAKDIVDHFEKRLEAMDGKGMIVCMSRRICVELYKEITKLRPQWHSDDDEQGRDPKVVMTVSFRTFSIFKRTSVTNLAANSSPIASRSRRSAQAGPRPRYVAHRI